MIKQNNVVIYLPYLISLQVALLFNQSKHKPECIFPTGLASWYWPFELNALYFVLIVCYVLYIPANSL